METISVIVPVYNDEKYINQCVDSILNQTYPKLEIILIDDGSTDKTAEICEQYRQKFNQIRVLHKINEGVGASRNAGLAMATGDYILFVDHDDWLDKNHIQNLYDLLKKNDADIAIGNFNEFHENDSTFFYYLSDDNYFEKTFNIKEWFELEYRTEYYNMSILFVVPWCKLYKRSLFKDIVYPIKAKVEDDLTTWKIYLLANKIAYMNKAIYTHRILNSSVTAKVNKSDVFPVSAIEERISLLKMINFDTKHEEEAYRWRLEVSRNNALKDGNYIKYRDTLQKLKILAKYKDNKAQ